MIDGIELMFDVTVRCTFNNPLCSFNKYLAALPLDLMNSARKWWSE